MSEGAAGFDVTVNTVKLGMERVFPLTTAHRSSFTLFLYEMEGVLSIDDLPDNLIGAAIERAEAFAREFYGESGVAGETQGDAIRPAKPVDDYALLPEGARHASSALPPPPS